MSQESAENKAESLELDKLNAAEEGASTTENAASETTEEGSRATAAKKENAADDALNQAADEHAESETEAPEAEPKKLTFPGLIDLLALLGVFFVSSIIGRTVAEIMGASPSTDLGLFTFISYVLTFGVTLLFALPYSYIRSNRSFSPIMLSFKGLNMATVLWGFIMIFTLGVVLEPLTTSFDKSYIDQLSRIMGSGDWFMFSAIFAAPILEELLFRGVIQGSMTNRFGPVIGIIVGALVFGLVHGNPVQMCNAFFIGMVLGYIYHRTKTLWSVIILHCLNNTFSYFMWLVGGNQIITLRDIVTNEKMYDIVYIVAAVITLVSFILLFRALGQKPKSTTDNETLDNKEA